jgi:hypothetical protein
VARIPQGNSVTVDGTITDPDTGQPTDGGTVKLVVHKPDGTALPDYTSPTHVGTGLYRQVIPAADLTQWGYYPRSWVVTGAGAGVSPPGGFTIIDPFEVSIVTLDEARSALGYTAADGTSDDDELRRFIGGITPVVESYKHEVIAAKTVAQDLTLLGDTEFWLTSTPVVSLTSLVSLDGLTTYDLAGLKARPTGQVKVLPGYPALTGDWVATSKAGYLTVPENYTMGALTALQWLWETQRGVGSSPSSVVGPGELDPRMLIAFPAKMKDWFGPPVPVFA